MRQILFHVPLLGIPVYGYGFMLFLAFILCQWLAKRLCKREGIDPDLIPDLTIYLFVSGILGGRLVFIATEWDRFAGWYWNSLLDNTLLRYISLWDGGLVLYGAIFGGAVGYFAYDHFRLKKQNVSTWKMIDVIAPCVALGVALGRIGCLFTGCCYGNVACEGCPAIQFPIYTNTTPAQFTAPAGEMIRRGYQTRFGFLFDARDLEVEAVEPGTPAAEVLKPGDHILEVNGKNVRELQDLSPTDGELKLTVLRDGKTEALPPFEPRSIGLNPTQIYETISMSLLLFFLLSYHPFKRRDGELMVFLMFGYGVHRFLNEMLRTDTDPVAFGLTLSQNISIGILAAAVVLAVIVYRRPANPPLAA